MKANLAGFLADSLALWKVEGTVAAGNSPVVAAIHAGDCVVWIERPDNDDVSWRWFVRWRGADMREERSRPCASAAGMLNAVRGALRVERGSAVRIAPSPAELPPLR